MVAVVAGGGLGLNLGSGSVLGGAGMGGAASFGRQSDRAYVNAATGNLVVQGRDELLAGRGPDAAGMRTYNSLGAFVDDNGDNWQAGLVRKVWLSSGSVNTAGSVVIRRDEDGSEALFTWDAGRSSYISTDGSGAYDSLGYAAGSNTWTFVDGSSRVVEVYGNGGRLLGATDASGQGLSFAYNGAGLLASVTTAAGEITYYDYNASNQLTQLRTLTKSTDAAGLDRTLTRVRYGYDASNRLDTVTVDLSPEDNSISDGRVFTTRYTYDGASKRIATITQSDGAKLSFFYDASARVQTVTDALGGVTTFSYDTANRATTVTDPLSQATVYRYDTTGRLTSITSPAVNGVSSVARYDYNGNGDVIQITDAEGRMVKMDYDAWGNVIRQTDSAGNVVRRTYNAQNQLLAESVATAGEPPSTTPSTRYVYDGTGTRLRFAISAEGRVSEFRYDSLGQRTNAIQYAGGAYGTSGWAWSTVPAENTMNLWIGGQDRSKTQLVDYAYDWRGQLARSTTYDSVDTAGNGQGLTVTQYIYDAAGLLIKTIDARNGVTQNTYDGLGRALTTTNALNQINVSSYDDVGGSVKTTAFNGLVSTSTYDKLGRIISLIQTDIPGNRLGEARSFYDADSRLRMTQDAAGNRQWFLYDEADRLVGQVNALGQLNETVYNKAGQATQTIAYGTLVNLTTLVDGSGQPTNVSLSSLRPTASASDLKSWNAYDSAGRLIKRVTPLGEVTEFTYDASGRLFLTRRYAGTVAISGLGSAPAPGAIAPTASSQDQVLRSFYDNDGLLLGSMDATGSLSENQYDAAGRLVAKAQRTQFASASQLSRITGAATTLAQIRPGDSTNDRKALNFYNARGQLVAQLDGEGGFAETLYDASGNVSQTLRYSLKATGFNTASSLSSIRTAAGGTQTKTVYEYDLLNRVLKQRVDPSGLNLTTTSVFDDVNRQLYVTAPNGTTTKTQFDAKGRATAATVDPTGLSLTTRTSYDASGRVDTVTDPKGIVTRFTYDPLDRKASQTVDPTGLNLITTYNYDAQGNLARVIDPKGRHTRYVYDQDHRLQYELDAEYGLTEYRYDALGNQIQRVRYIEKQTSIQTVNIGGGLISNSFVSITAAAAKDQLTRYVYDAAGRQTHSVDAAGAVTRYDYDAVGQVVARRELANSVPTGTALKVWRRDGTNSSASLSLGNFRAGDTVTATVRFKTTANTSGRLYLGNTAQSTYSNVVYGNDGWQTLTVTQTMASDGVLSVYVYGDRDGATPDNSHFVLYDNLRVSSVQRGEVLNEVFLPQTAGWGISGQAEFAQVTLADAGGQAQLAAFLPTLADSARDHVTRYVYDAAGRQAYSVDATGSVTQYEYDASGQVVAKRELANPAPAGGALKVWHREGTNRSAARYLGTFKAGDTVTATVRFKAAPNAQGYLFLGNAGGPNSMDNTVETSAMGNDGWQTLTVTRTMTHDDSMWVYVYGDPSSTDNTHFVLYDNVRVSSRLRGDVLNDNFDNVTYTTDYTSTSGWYLSGQAEQAPLGLVEAASQAQLAAFLPTLLDATRDRITRYVYDAAGRQTYSVDAAGAATRYDYDAAGQVLARRKLANQVPTGSALKVWRRDGTNSAASLNLGTFKAGDTVTATVRFKTTANTSGRLYLGNTAQSTYSNVVYGNDGWQTLTVTQTMASDGVLSVYVYGDRDGATPDNSHFVLYDNLRVSSVQRGDVLSEDFSSQSLSGWNIAGQVEFTPVTLADIGGQPQLAAFLPTLVDSARDHVTRYVYDAAGRQAYSVDATGSVTQYEYDASGQVVAKRELANPAPAGGALKVWHREGTNRSAARYLGTFKAGDTVTATVRFKAAPNAQGYLFLGNAGGPNSMDNTVETSAMGNDGWQTLTVTRTMTHDDSMWVYVYGDPSSTDNTHFVLYDNVRVSSRLRGDVLSDNFDNVTYTTDYASTSGWYLSGQAEQAPLGLVETASQAQLAAFLPTLLDATRDRVTRYVYDAAGRIAYTQDTLGNVVRNRYDAAGQVVEQIAYARRIATSTAATVTAFDAAVQADTAYDHRTRYLYDATGRMRFAIALDSGNLNRGVVTETVYDTLGHVTRTIQYADYVAFNSITDSSTEASVRALLPAFSGAAPASARETLYTYDLSGRLVYAAQADWVDGTSKYFSLSERRYDAFGQLNAQFAYASDIVLSDLPLNVSSAQIAARVIANAVGDRGTRYTYDASGRLLTATDGEGYVERYAYDAFGRKIQYTNKNNATTGYSYDAAGRLIEELSAAVDVYAVNADTLGVDAAISSSLGQRLATRYAYDAFGNLLSRTEAAGIANQQRTTRYEYDALGRQIKTRFAAVGVYDSSQDNLGTNGAGGAAVSRSEVIRELVTQTFYDAFGQAVANLDVSGNYSYKTYDQLGRVVLEIDANHNVSKHLYSDDEAGIVGQYSTLQRVGASASFTDSLSISADVLKASAQAAQTAAGQRSVTTYLDQRGRTIRTDDLLEGVFSYDAASNQSGVWTRSTTYAYNVFGNLEVKGIQLDRNGQTRLSRESYAYDLKGDLVRTVDAEGGVTGIWRNAFGEVYQSIEYATKIDPNTPAAAVPDLRASMGATSAIGFDRVTQNAYDRRGLLRSSTLAGAQTGQRSGTNTLGTQLANVQTRYQYDGAGNAVQILNRVFDVNGNLLETGTETINIYDQLGRLVASTNGYGFGQETRYDALGNAVQSTRRANAFTIGVSAPADLPYQAYTLSGSPAASTDDQTTTTRYDALGHAVQVRDALNSGKPAADRYLSYDAAGRVAKQWQAFQDSEGQRNAVNVFGYDKVGQQTSTTTLTQRQRTDALTYAIEGAVYNAFGEITSKTLQERGANGVYGTLYTTQQNWYDAGGRLWKSTTGGAVTVNGTNVLAAGITKIYWYDLQDHVTATFAGTADTAGRDLSNASVQDVAAYGLTQGVSRTNTTYDRAGRITRQTTNGSTHGSSVVTTSASQTLDRWGNVVSITKNGSERLRYRYDAGNRVISEVQVASDVWTPGATAAVTRDVEKRIFYDAWGHNIGTIDGLANANAAKYDDRGRLQYEYHADGGVVSYSYDGLNRLTGKVDEVLRQFSYTYDRGDHETSRKVVDSTGSHRLGESTYDELGRKKSDTSGEDTANWYEIRSYDYDARGLMWRSTDALNKSTLSEYDLAGRKTRETDANGLETTWAYDMPTGLLTRHVDLGGAVYSYTYNLLGQLKTQTSTRGQNVAYTYFEDGRVKEIREAGAGTTTYDYDANGNRTREIFGSLRNITSTYDNQDRLKSATDTASATDLNIDSAFRYDVQIGYDAAGNRSRVWGQKEEGETLQATSYGYNKGGLKAVEQRFTYDAMNRVTSNGDRYDLAGRRTITINAPTAGMTDGSRNRYTYDFANRLLTTNYTQLQGTTETPLGTEWELRSVEYRDGQQIENNHDYGQVNNAASRYRTRVTTTTYDAQGRATNVTEQEQGRNASWSDGSSTRTTYATGLFWTSKQVFSYDAVGNVAQVNVDAYAPKTTGGEYYQVKDTYRATVSTTNYTYYLMEGYNERGQALSVSNWNISGAYVNTLATTYSGQSYDANGKLVQVARTLSNGTISYTGLINDFAGHVVQRINRAWGNGTITPEDSSLRQWTPVNGGGSATAATTAAISGTPQYGALANDSGNYSAQTNFFVNDQLFGSRTYQIDTQTTNGQLQSRHRGWSTTVNPSGLDGQSASTAGGQLYTARPGDTAAGLAQRFYGDAKLWYVIADANGLGVISSSTLPVGNDAAIAEGTTVKIPNVTRGSNTSTSFKVYDATRAIGATSPEAIAPPPPKDRGCGVLGQVIMIVVAVAVTYITAGALASTMGPLLGGAIGGAAGSIASQGVGIAIGQQQGFSWKQVGLGALGGAVSGAVMGVPQANVDGLFGGGAQGLAKGLFGVTDKLAAASINAVATNVMTQGLAVATGLQDKFSWRSVAASAIAAPAAQYVAGQLSGPIGDVFKGNAVGTNVATNIVRGVVSQSVRMLVTRQGKMDFASIAADAFGNAIGESLASQTSDYSRWGTDTTETDRLLARYPAPAPDLPSVDFETRPPLPDINERPLPEIGEVPGLRPEARLVRLPRVVVTGSRAGGSSGLTSETAAEIGGISGREEGLALAGRYLDYSKQLRGHAANAGSSAIAKTYNSMANGYAAASREANRVSGQFTTYSSVPRQTVNPPSFSLEGSYGGAMEAGLSSVSPWDSRTLGQIDKDLNRFTGLVVTAPVTAPLLFTGWGFAGAVTLGGGTAGYQYFTSGNVNAYDVMEMGSLGAALPSLATSAYSLTTRAWSALSFTEAASASRFAAGADVETLISLDVQGIRAQRVLMGENGKVAVIGRSMGDFPQRGEFGVVDFTRVLRNDLGMKTELFAGPQIKPEWFQEVQALRAIHGVDILPDSVIKTTEIYKQNMLWAQKLVDQRYTVVDIGNPGFKGASPFYLGESTTVFNGGTASRTIDIAGVNGYKPRGNP